MCKCFIALKCVPNLCKLQVMQIHILIIKKIAINTRSMELLLSQWRERNVNSTNIGMSWQMLNLSQRGREEWGYRQGHYIYSTKFNSYFIIQFYILFIMPLMTIIKQFYSIDIRVTHILPNKSDSKSVLRIEQLVDFSNTKFQLISIQMIFTESSVWRWVCFYLKLMDLMFCCTAYAYIIIMIIIIRSKCFRCANVKRSSILAIPFFRIRMNEMFAHLCSMSVNDEKKLLNFWREVCSSTFEFHGRNNFDR